MQINKVFFGNLGKHGHRTIYDFYFSVELDEGENADNVIDNIAYVADLLGYRDTRYDELTPPSIRIDA